MAMIKGIQVTLKLKTQTGTDAIGDPIYTTTDIVVDNVLVGQPSSEDAATTLELYGRRAAYTLAIPKGDINAWENVDVVFFGRTWHTIGIPTMGIESNVPLSWNKKVMVEAYE